MPTRKKKTQAASDRKKVMIWISSLENLLECEGRILSKDLGLSKNYSVAYRAYLLDRLLDELLDVIAQHSELVTEANPCAT
jgi:CRISPR/Cas system-associated protein Csx1